MKGIFAISETFMKILITGYLAIIILSIFFAINQYHLISLESKMDRESLIVGNVILSSCIVETHGGQPVKCLLSENKIKEEISLNPSTVSNISCLNYDKGIFVEIYDKNENLLYGVGNSSVCQSTNPCQKRDSTTITTFPATLNRTTKIEPVILKIFLGFK